MTSQQLEQNYEKPSPIKFLSPLQGFLEQDEFYRLTEQLEKEFGSEAFVVSGGTTRTLSLTKPDRSFVFAETMDSEITHTGFYLELQYSHNFT